MLRTSVVMFLSSLALVSVSAGCSSRYDAHDDGAALRGKSCTTHRPPPTPRTPSRCFDRVDLGAFGGDSASAVGLNDRGDIAGSRSLDALGLFHAYRWSEGTLVDLVPDASTMSNGNAIDAEGTMAVTVMSTTDWVAHGALWDGCSLQPLGALIDGGGVVPSAMNDDGVVVGDADVAPFVQHAFRWAHGAMLDLGAFGGTESHATDVNEAGHVVGYAEMSSSELRAFLWRDDGSIDLGPTQGGLKLNEHDAVMGLFGDTPFRASLWLDGTKTDLGTLGGDSAFAVDIDEEDRIVGGSTTPSGDVHAFLWDGAMHDLGTVGGTRSQARDINEHGQIVGWAIMASGEEHAVVWMEGVAIDLGSVAPMRIARIVVNERGEVLVEASTLHGPHMLTLFEPKPCEDDGEEE